MQDQENKRTLVYLLVAGMALLVAWEPWYRVPEDATAPPEVGKKLFPEFADPLAATSLDVMRFDEDTATIHPFKVAKANGVWSIPSHSGYPADAQQHMADAATSLLDLEILGVMSSGEGDRELYGVITPDPSKLRQGMTGVGTRVTIKDDKDKALADLVIGKEVKEQPDLRYVRRADRDQICKVRIKTDKLSTKFEDWIEKDLLKLNALDVRDVELNDYSTQESVREDNTLGLGVNKRSRMKFNFDDSKSNWTLSEIAEFDEKGQPVPGKLADDEELNTQKLNDLKTALDDLKIVDVERKPQGLSQDLRASEDFVKNREALVSLATRGFYPVQQGGQIEMYSSEGEATCTTKDGVRYVLRFGQLAGGEESKDDLGQKPDEKDKKNPALNRFLFVMAQFDESQIPKPKLEPVPGGDKPAEEPAADSKDEAKPDQSADDPAKSDEPDAAKTGADGAKPSSKSKGKSKVPQKKTADESGGDEPAADDKADEAKAEDKKDAAPATPEEEKRIAIEKENKRKQAEYDDAIKKGQDKVKELNDRFADWYFIISDDVYKKVHLSREDVVKKKETKEAKESETPDAAGAVKLPE